MSSVEENDENCGVYPGVVHSSSSNDCFALDQPTGRPSILRQTENLPSKSVPRGTKVCFQTPRRDPVTKRILSPTKSAKMTSVVECTKVMEGLNLDNTNILPQEAYKECDQPKEEASPYPDDNMQMQSKGDYQLDFDNLDAINPFQASIKMAFSPARDSIENLPKKESQHPDSEHVMDEPVKMETALDETLPFTPSVENSLVDTSANISSTESSVVTIVKISAIEEQDSCTATSDETQHPKEPLCADQDKVSHSFVEDTPLPVKGLYNLDLDNLDAVNPFQMGGSKIKNSPVLRRKMPDNGLLDDELQIKEEKPADIVDVPEVAKELPLQLEVMTAALEPQPDVAPSTEGSIKLEFNFNDGSEVEHKPPPKKFGKRPPGAKSNAVKPVSDKKASKETQGEPDASDITDLPVPKTSYAFDYDKLDDPNFNPFGTKTSIKNSPTISKKASTELTESSLPEPTDKPEEKEIACAGESVPASQHPNPVEVTDDKAASDHGKEFPTETEQLDNLAELRSTMLIAETKEKTQADTSEFSDMFVPGTTFMANDFDRQIDYLEQFGSSSFKESALRKQSLYLKFDPLLRESPKKSAGSLAQASAPRPASLASRLETPKMTEKESANGPQNNYFKLFDVTAPSPPLLENLVPPFLQPANTEEAIIEVLKYSQKDLDAAIARVQAEAKEERAQWDVKYKKVLDDGQEMRKIIAEFELMIAKMMADQEKEREVAQTKLNAALLEKDQVASDLNAMERSMSDLFKRLDKYKDVIEGYKKNEDTLKACAQDYLARIKKEEQRYQTLKAHAEEKISHANEEIAEVRTKYRAEISALQAQLRREHLKVQSLTTTIDQKEKEAEDLTKLCDELISKVQKG